MPKIDIAAVCRTKGSGYALPFDEPCTGRIRRRLGEAGGLRDFGVNFMRLPQGAWSSQLWKWEAALTKISRPARTST